jgi:hypothetical protein
MGIRVRRLCKREKILGSGGSIFLNSDVEFGVRKVKK